jgi:hypothetical protein
LKGATLVEYLITDFEILNQFKTVKIGLPVMTYASCIDLEILIKEMMDYDIPSDLQWKEIVRLGKTKCSFQEPTDNAQVSPKWQIRQRTKAGQMEREEAEESEESTVGS